MIYNGPHAYTAQLIDHTCIATESCKWINKSITLSMSEYKTKCL